VLLAGISNPEKSISKIIDLIRPDVGLAEIAFSVCRNVENEH
jgi:hypothetical protein